MKLLTSILFLSISLGLVASEHSIENNEYLTRAKFKLINGDINMSEYYLNQISEEKINNLLPIKKRYQAIIEFIKGDYKKSNETLSTIIINDVLTEGNSYRQICLLKLLNALAINDIEVLKIDQNRCQARTGNTSKNDQYWLDTMIKLKLNNMNGFTNNLFPKVNHFLTEDEMTKLWLKTGLFFNHDEDFISIVEKLDASSYQSKRLEEIIGFMYLRLGETAKALAFVDHIDTANAENIKGNISLQKKEYEVALGHFKLAMLKKQDSINSLERSIPLTWLLNQFEDGITLLDSPTLLKIDPRNKRSIKIAYLIKMKKIAEAEKEILILTKEYENYLPNEIYMMSSYLSLLSGATTTKYDKRYSEELAEKACKLHDGINCWQAMKISQWDNIGKTILRNDDTFSDKEMTLETLKNAVAIEPLKEQIQVDQHDIEELDSSTVKLK